MRRALVQLSARHDSAILWTVTGYERGAAFYQAMGWTPSGRLRADGAETALTHPLRAPN